MDVHSSRRLFRREPSFGVVVQLLAGDDMDLSAGFRQVERQAAQHLAGCRMIREEEAIEKNEAFHGVAQFLSDCARGGRSLTSRAAVVNWIHAALRPPS